MNKDDILRLAIKADLWDETKKLERFAGLVAEPYEARRLELQKQIEALQEQIKRADMEKALAVAQERERPEPTTGPVAWMEAPYGAIRANLLYRWTAPQTLAWSLPLYAAPPQRKPLTADEVVHLIFENTKINPNQRDDAVLFGYIVNAVRAVERAHGIG